jgi:hypothetical protein
VSHDIDGYVRSHRGEILDHLVEHLRAAQAQPLQVAVWDETLDDYVGGDVERTAATPPRSMLLTIAQYWNDNADDECHARLIASTRTTPRWPHVCDVNATHLETCSDCMVPKYGYVPWLSYANTDSFQAFAVEGATQGFDENDAFRPYAIARIDDAGEISVERVHPATRAWLDLPVRPVVPMPISERVATLFGESIAIAADELQRLGDPRGEMIAHGDLDALAQYGRTWLGSIEPHVPRSAVRYEQGVPVEVGIYADAMPVIDPREHLPWCFRPHVRFLPRSVRFPIPRARSLGPISDLSELPPDLERLEIMASAIAQPIPAVRELVILGRVDIAAVRALAVPRIEIAIEAEHHLEELAKWRDAQLPVIVSMFDTETERASGWSVDFGKRTLTHAGYHRFADEERHREIQALLGFDEIGSATWAP